VFGAMEIGMALPKAIQAAIEAADAIVDQMNAVPPEAAHPEDTPANPDPVVEAEHVVAAVPEVVTPQQPQHNEWESRFNTLRGKYDAEVPRLSNQVRELNQAMQTLMQENERLKTETKAKTNLVTDADKEAFGSDLVDLIDRAAKQATSDLREELAHVKAAKTELERRLGGVGEELSVSAQDRFQTKLTQMVPTWATVNSDHNFLLWCGQIDPVFGVPRQAALDSAAQRLDANAAAAVFQAYLNSLPKPTNEVRKELQSQVAPNRSRTAVAPSSDETSNKVWTDGEIRQFYNEARRGSYTQAEVDRIEEQINRAVTEGRIR
jgi:hypothetical protein